MRWSTWSIVATAAGCGDDETGSSAEGTDDMGPMPQACPPEWAARLEAP